MKYEYATAELREIVTALAVGEKDVRKRLSSVTSGLIKLNRTDFPNEFKSDWAWIMENLTKRNPRYLSNGEVQFGSIENTMRNVRNSTASKIAERIVALYFQLQNLE